MNDLVIKVSKRSRLIDLDHSTLGIVGENLQEKLIFTFQDEFVDGMARLEYEIDSEKKYVLMERVGQSYTIPVRNVLLSKEGNVDLQLVITQEGTEIPVFKSEVFTLYCKKSIEAVGEAPSSYELWIEKANQILLEASRVDINGQKSGNETTIEITRKSGEKKVFKVLDGKDGKNGEDGATGNGIERIALTSTVGLVDTYTIYYTDGTTSTFEVTNGETPDLSNYVQKPEFNESQAEQDERTLELQAELDRYKLLENALPHTENETASDYVTLNNTAKAPMEISLTPQTSQETTTGKQLFDNNRLNYDFSNVNASENILSSLPTGIRYSTSRLSGSPIVIFKSIDLSSYTGKIVRMKASYGEIGRIRIGLTNSDVSIRTQKAQSSASDETISFEIPTDLGDTPYLFYALVLRPTESDFATDFTNVVLTIDNDNMNYEPYTGGIPSPNPDYPEDIHCTTGENQVKVTNVDSTEETTYPISLGTKEMFNINNVSDGFVYDETMDKFYINRKIGKVVLNGSENWTYNTSNEVYILNLGPVFPQRTTIVPFSNYFIGQTSSSFAQVLDKHISLQSTNTADSQRFLIKFLDVGSTVGDLQQWLFNHNTIVIYPLATYTSEEITDTTLISQLRAIKNALSMQGATHIISTASGSNLPFLIKARAVQTIERT